MSDYVNGLKFSMNQTIKTSYYNRNEIIIILLNIIRLDKITQFLLEVRKYNTSVYLLSNKITISNKYTFAAVS